MGRSLYREALQRPDAGALTQALGTRDSDYLRPTVQRFILEEDGILLLCSDGLSDHHLVEQYWPEITDPFFLGKRTLLEIAHAWIDLANQKNGHDNTSLALLHVRVSTPVPVVNLPSMEPPISRWSEASSALAEPPTASEPETAPPPRSGKGLLILAVLALGLLIAGVGVVVWREMTLVPRQEQSPPASP
jgi:protein phosphatase